jgi:hypothetical protein
MIIGKRAGKNTISETDAIVKQYGDSFDGLMQQFRDQVDRDMAVFVQRVGKDSDVFLTLHSFILFQVIL